MPLYHPAGRFHLCSKRAEMCILSRLMFGLMASVALIHVYLLVFAIVPYHLVALGLGLQVVYLGLIRQMSNIKLLTPLSLTAIGILRLVCHSSCSVSVVLIEMLMQLAFTSKNYAGLCMWG